MFIGWPESPSMFIGNFHHICQEHFFVMSRTTRVKTHKLLQVCKQVVTSLQTSCDKSVHNLSTSCVRTACS